MKNKQISKYIVVLVLHYFDHFDFVFQLLHVKLESTREQLENKCKQTEVLDATNFDLERELAEQRRENERHQQRIKEYVNISEVTSVLIIRADIFMSSHH